MSIMFRNSNAGIERELAGEDYKAHKVRNRVAVLAVVLTTVLITVIFTVGFSMVRTVSLAASASPGPGADGNCVYGDYEILEKVRELPQVEWAVFNVLDNAVKYGNRGSSIEIEMAELTEYALVSVRNEGIRIGTEEYHKVFQRFYRGKEAAGEEGVGLGLTIAREVLEGEKGYMKTETLCDGRTEFSMYFSKRLFCTEKEGKPLKTDS